MPSTPMFSSSKKKGPAPPHVDSTSAEEGSSVKNKNNPGALLGLPSGSETEKESIVSSVLTPHISDLEKNEPHPNADPPNGVKDEVSSTW